MGWTASDFYFPREVWMLHISVNLVYSRVVDSVAADAVSFYTLWNLHVVETGFQTLQYGFAPVKLALLEWHIGCVVYADCLLLIFNGV